MGGLFCFENRFTYLKGCYYRQSPWLEKWDQQFQMHRKPEGGIELLLWQAKPQLVRSRRKGQHLLEKPFCIPPESQKLIPELGWAWGSVTAGRRMLSTALILTLVLPRPESCPVRINWRALCPLTNPDLFVSREPFPRRCQRSLSCWRGDSEVHD